MQKSVPASDDLLVQLSECDGDDKRGAYSLAQAADLLSIPRRRLRAWFRAGLIQPAIEMHGVPYFDFQLLASARTLLRLTDAGISTTQLRIGLERLRSWMADPDKPFEQLVMLERNGHLLMRLEAGLVEPSGQLCFDFSEDHAVIESHPVTAEEWFQLGCEHEEDGAMEDALHAYRQALIVGGPDPDVCFNLGNVLFTAGRGDAAIERWRVTLELAPDHAEAWNNLGVALGQSGRLNDAGRALSRAVGLGYAAARHNMAWLNRRRAAMSN
jgi:tetratricopeptide (TPR) repeat protein